MAGQKLLRVGIVGCGKMGEKRARSVECCPVTWLADLDKDRAFALQKVTPEAHVTDHWSELVEAGDVDVVIVATDHSSLAEIAFAAVDRGKHVLVEKPGGRSVVELEPVVSRAAARGVLMKVGFNHRHHPALRRAKSIADSCGFGPLYHVRGRYGHGGRPGYEREWRASRVISGGGELIDQGMHLIDLSRWFLGEFSDVHGVTPTYYWNMDVEDNVFLMLRTEQGQVAWLHASWTEWKNLFSFEVFGRHGKLEIQGLGGSYGTERLAYYRMSPQLGPPETTIWEFPSPDESWRLEFCHFLDAIASGQQPEGNGEDALAALRIVERVYGGQG